MTKFKLLSAVALATLITSNAFAMDINFTGASFQSPIADELCLDEPGVEVTAPFTMQVLTEAPATLPQSMIIEITLSDDLAWSSAVAGGAVTAKNAVFGSVISGGAAGTQTVTLTLDADVADPGNFVDFNLPISQTSCATDSSGVTVTFTNAITNLPLDLNSTLNTADVTDYLVAPLETPFKECAPGIIREVNADDTDKEILLTAYNTLSDGIIGDITYTIDPNVAVDAVGTPILATDIVGVDVNVSVGAPAGLSGGLVDAATVPFNGAGVAAHTGIAYADGVPMILSVTSAVTVPIDSQSTAVRSELEFTPASGLTDKAVITKFLEPLSRDGLVFGRFDWVGDSSKSTANYFRITDLPASTSIDFLVDLNNTTTGVDDGLYAGSVMTSPGGEAIITSANDFGIAGMPLYGRADVQICLETGETGVDMDRLLASGGTVSNYGDDANGGRGTGLANEHDDTNPRNDADN